MKKWLFLSIVFATVGLFGGGTTTPEIIPKPKEMKLADGAGFKIIPGKTTVSCRVAKAQIIASNAAVDTEMRQYKDPRAAIKKMCERLDLKQVNDNGDIQISINFDGANGIPEYYSMEANDKNLFITAHNGYGVCWGIQTLYQLCPPEIYKGKLTKEVVIPALSITDEPDYSYRGRHLDVCRHFYTVEEIKTFLDLMAMHKVNKFHWHLTDDQGWRIEIKKYPKLTEIGSVRAESPTPGKRTVGDKTPYGPYFYTQEQAKEVIAYAADLGIEVIPEIEMPGHARAALAAYPELGCTGGPYTVWTKWGIDIEAFCAGSDTTLDFMKDVLVEICELFPSRYVHIGGDECKKERWKKCAKCQARIKAHELKDEYQLQSWFVTQIGKFLESKGKDMIGWDEILEGGIPPGAIIMSWRSTEGGKKAANAHHGVIMTPKAYSYHDYPQSLSPGEPEAIGRTLVSLPQVYSFDVSCGLPPETAKYIKGPQANLWSEYFYKTETMFYFALPRMAALAEVGWTPYAVRKGSFKDFERRLLNLYPRYRAMGVPFRFTPPQMPEKVIRDADTVLDFGTLPANYKMFVKIDNGELTELSKPLKIETSCRVTYQLQMDGDLMSRPATIRYLTKGEDDAEKAKAEADRKAKDAAKAKNKK